MRLTDWLTLTDWQHPERWLDRWFIPASPDRDMEWPLDWLLFVGGPVRRRAEEILGEWVVAQERGGLLRVLLHQADDPLIQHERAAWLREFSTRNAKVRVVTERLKFERAEFDAARQEWAVGLLGEQAVRLSSEFERFAAENLERRHEPPWIFWSRLPLWLRLQKQVSRKETVEADLKFAAICVALSPHDEEAERAALRCNELKLNPAFDVVNCGDSLKSLVRRYATGEGRRRADSFSVQIRELDPLDAVIIDCIREDFRIFRQDLLLKIENVGRQEFSSSIAMKRIEELETAGLLLSGAAAGQD